MTLASAIMLLAGGLAAGFASGMLGLGGAFIITPVQYLVYTGMGLPADLAIKTAFGTSMLVVLPTAVSGAWRHHRKQSVSWRAAAIMGSCSLVVALGAATLATHLSGSALKTAFGAIVLLSGFRTITARPPQGERGLVDNPWLWAAWAIPVGFVAGIFGVGGGIIMIPVFVLAFRFKMHYAIGTSLAVMILTSLGGIAGYIINGIGVPGRLSYSLGYVNIPAWLLLAVPSAAMAQAGALTAHKIPQKPLMYIFMIVIIYMGLKMIGVFDWLGWPV
ncbi:MAG: sulfite exporter TauE/SafE family protein [Chloroflexota bacterium]